MKKAALVGAAMFLLGATSALVAGSQRSQPDVCAKLSAKIAASNADSIEFGVARQYREDALKIRPIVQADRLRPSAEMWIKADRAMAKLDAVVELHAALCE